MPIFNSIIPYVGDGVQTRWNANFAGGYIDPAHVFVVRDGVATVAVLDGSAVVIDPPVPSGAPFNLERRTPVDRPLVDYSRGADFSEENLDTTAKQSVFVAAEAADLGSKALRLPIGGEVTGTGFLLVAADGSPAVQPYIPTIIASGTTFNDDGDWGGETLSDGVWG